MIEFDYTILIQFFNFLIVLIILNFLLFKPVLRAIEKRDETIRSLSTQAEELNREFENLKTRYEEFYKDRVRPIYEEKERIVSQAVKDMVSSLEEIKKGVFEELNALRVSLERERERIKEEMESKLGMISKEIAEKVLSRSLN